MIYTINIYAEIIRYGSWGDELICLTAEFAYSKFGKVRTGAYIHRPLLF